VKKREEMRRPKVLFLSTSLNIGGTESFVVQLATHMRESYDISIGYLKEKGPLGELLEKQGFPVRRFGSPWQLLRYLKESRIEVLHTFLYRANVMGRFCGKLAGVSAVISTQQAVDIWKSSFLSVLDRLSAIFCDRIVTNSKAALQSLQRREKIPQWKMRVVYNGFDFSRLSFEESREGIRKDLGIAPGVRVVVSIMRLHYDKGADFLPEIAAQTGTGIFMVAGDGPARAAVEEEIKKRGLGHRVKLLGWRQDVLRLLRAADIFLLPSREESFPQAVLEAMASGVPAVAADVGGVRELIDDGSNGIVVPPGNTARFASALQTLLSDEVRRDAMGRAALEKSSCFSEKRMVREIDAVYQELIGNRDVGIS
jgi:glycosyltransferase involved in cell wall biosynthesis